jgi:electron transfer flavoprotein beta subunit
MHVVVLLKRVPDTTAKIKPAASGRGIDPQGVEFIISPYDEMALERAIQLQEAGVAKKTTVVCLGPKDASKELRKALAMGADEAVHLVEDQDFRCPAATAACLAAALGELKPDLVLCGWKAIDDDTAAVGGIVAERLGFAYASFVVKLDAAAGATSVSVHREVEGATEVVDVPLPAVVTAQKGLAEPRFASLKGIMAAKKKPLVEKAPGRVLENASDLVALKPPPARPPGRILGQGKDAVPELVRVLRDEVHVL